MRDQQDCVSILNEFNIYTIRPYSVLLCFSTWFIFTTSFLILSSNLYAKNLIYCKNKYSLKPFSLELFFYFSFINVHIFYIFDVFDYFMKCDYNCIKIIYVHDLHKCILYSYWFSVSIIKTVLCWFLIIQSNPREK